jgi:hypothetical protein
MANWQTESFDLVNQWGFRISDPGPLHQPIHRFKITRDENLAIILETEGPIDAIPAAVYMPAGTVYFNTDQVKLTNPGGYEAVLTGVGVFSRESISNVAPIWTLKEVARVHHMTVTLDDPGKAAYTIEWLDNLRADPFIWPDAIRTTKETTKTVSIAPTHEGITITSADRGTGSSNGAAKLEVAGQTLYICAPRQGNPDAKVERGYIVYIGTPDDLFRRKIRTALSFSLGVYLAELGHTLCDQEWNIVSATSRRAYNLAKRTFDVEPMPLARLSSRGSKYDLGRTELTRMMNALVADYDRLDLGNLSWAYWHACTATPHIAPAHFGAAIEALQRAFIKSSQTKIATKILDHEQFEILKAAIADAQIPDDRKIALKANLNGINRLPQRAILKEVLRTIGITLGEDEYNAWNRRNDAAHGKPVPEGDELAAIRDMKLLRGLFNRMLLRISNAADYYIDYVSLNHPHRQLQDPVSPGVVATHW